MAEHDSGIKFIYDEAAVIVPTPDGECLVIGDLHIGAEQDPEEAQGGAGQHSKAGI